MQLALTLVGPDADLVTAAIGKMVPALAAVRARVKEPRPLGQGAVELLVEADDLAVARAVANTTLVDATVDHCVQPWNGRRKQLLIADMDSTIIGCECIDELADFAGVKAQVSAITERAMRGELNFEAALRERVAMLKGLPVADLRRAYDERVRLNPGARVFVRTMAAHGARCLLVSGGFSFFTERVAAAAGFHENRANSLGLSGEVLDGTVGSPILGREAKLANLVAEAERLGLAMDACLAIGDGANDLAMIEAAGLGLAYRAKPIVAADADAKIDHTDLTTALYFQGYAQADFVTD